MALHPDDDRKCSAFADEAPDNGCLGSLSAGDSCVTDDGTSGTCVDVQGELICKPVVAGAERSALPWIGAGLAFLALCAGIATRPTLSTPGAT